MHRNDPGDVDRKVSRLRLFLPLGIVLVAGAIFAGVLSVRALQASGPVRVFVNPALTTQLWYQPTPITIRVEASGWSGTGHTPVSGFQYHIKWDSSKLRWVSGPLPHVGPGTPTPVPILPCAIAPNVVQVHTATPTPPGFVPTYTPTRTPTPMEGTPSNTPTQTFTPSITPTPSGYLVVGCVQLGGISNPPTPHPSGIIGTFKFEPIATGQTQSSVTLQNTILTSKDGSPIPATVTSGSVLFAACNDVNNDGFVNILDLSLVASAFLKSVGQPGYNPDYDVNNDGTINILDMSLVAGAFLLTC